MTHAPRFDTLLLVGVGHSGSTLFGSLMNAHSSVGCVGEFARIGESIANDRPCSCGTKVEECSFWQPLLPALGGARSFDPFRLDLGHYALLRRALGKPVVLDTSKSILVRMVDRWFSRLKSPRVGFIFLVRDSRGVLNSALRQGKELEPRLDKHEKWVQRVERFIAKRPEQSSTLFYEDLCAGPEAELRRVCAWAGLEFEQGMLEPEGKPHHMVHANSMKYLGRSNQIRLDERWRTEVSPEARAKIEAVMRRVPLLRQRYLDAAVTR